MKHIQNYINGRFYDTEETLACFNPATGQAYARIPRSTSSDVNQAVQAASEAFGHWSGLSPESRHDHLTRLSNAILDNLEDLAHAESIDNGKPLKLARAVDIPRVVSNFKFFATAAMQHASEAHPMPGHAINYTLKSPLGVVGCISPWNLPLYLLSWKIAPALAVGNTVVAKPSEVTPMTAYLMTKIMADIGFPPGVLNIVHGAGPEAGEAIVRHPDIKAISFTGGTRTGARIAEIAAPEFKKLSLELGGKNPTLIFADCDYEKALKTALKAAFANQGQICLCGSRILVERSIYDRFRQDFVEGAQALRIGDPRDPETQIGAVVSQEHMDKILHHIRQAQDEGGTLLCGGKRVTLPGPLSEGYFLQPTVIEGLDPQCSINQQEVFGPVVSLIPFDTEAEAISYANGVRYGLSSNVWTRDVQRALRVSEALEVGIVWVNCWLLRDLRTPFGGMKDSGVGREGGWNAMEFFTEKKNVCLKY